MVGNPDVPAAVMTETRESVNGAGRSLRYPAEHGRYYTIMQFVRYNRTNPKRRAIRVNQADIVLPLPSNLREYYAMQYGDVEFDKLGGVIDTADQLVNGFLKSGGRDVGDLNWDMIGTQSVEFAQALSRRAANFFSNDLGGVIDRVTGTVVNPHVTSVFRGVGLREHVLSWKLHARTADESAAVKSIVEFIRERMHPEKKSNFLLNFPDEVYVKFFAEDNEFLHPIFKAVVTSIDADYSSDGTNAFFKGTDSPVVVNFTVNIKEVEGLTREDFTGQTDEVGVETATAEDGVTVTNGAFGGPR